MNQISFYKHKLDFEIDSADLFDIIQTPGNNILLVDVRSAEAYNKEHIPGAVSIPHRELDTEKAKSLDKSKIYIAYCDGIGCNGSTKGALKFAQLGFNVKELIGGLDWWKRDGYATEGESPQIGNEIACGC